MEDVFIVVYPPADSSKEFSQSLKGAFSEDKLGAVYHPVIGSIFGSPHVERFISDVVLVSLNSAGAFTALYKIIVALIQKDKDQEFTLQRGNVRVIIKGHNIPEETVLLEQLVEESLITPTAKKSEDLSNKLAKAKGAHD